MADLRSGFMTTTRYTPEDIRDIGARALPAVADSYDPLAPLARTIDLYKDRLFGTAYGTYDNGDLWVQLFDLYKLAVEETPISLDAMGAALVEAADKYDEAEQDAVVDLQRIMSGLEGAAGQTTFDEHREVLVEEREAEERAREEAAEQRAENAPPPPFE